MSDAFLTAPRDSKPSHVASCALRQGFGLDIAGGQPCQKREMAVETGSVDKIRAWDSGQLAIWRQSIQR